MLVTAAEYASKYGVSKSTVCRAAAEGRIKRAKYIYNKWMLDDSEPFEKLRPGAKPGRKKEREPEGFEEDLTQEEEEFFLPVTKEKRKIPENGLAKDVLEAEKLGLSYGQYMMRKGIAK